MRYPSPPRRRITGFVLLPVALAIGASVASCSSGGDAPSPDPGSSEGVSSQVAAPPIHAKWDYQLGGAYPVPDGVRVVSRDSTASPAPGLYNICYINAFQSQPGAEDWWQNNHPDLLLRDGGDLVIDKDWNEPLLDVSTEAKRGELARIEYGWIDGCAAKGFQAVEPDNLDSYGRSNGLLDASANVAFTTLLAQHAHADGLAIAQKNAAELLNQRGRIGFDFAVSEQCGSTDECGEYAAAYDDKVVDVEYDDDGFAKACQDFGAKISIVRRDHDVTAPGGAEYVYRTC